MKVLIDTSALIRSFGQFGEFSSAARALMDDAAVTKIYSVAVFWEMTIKHALGRLPLPAAPAVIWSELEKSGTGIVLNIFPRHLERLGSLEDHHRDPFDRLMIAQAFEDGLEVISSDSQWDAYGVKRIW